MSVWDLCPLEAFGRTARVCSVRIGACTRAFALERSRTRMRIGALDLPRKDAA